MRSFFLTIMCVVSMCNKIHEQASPCRSEPTTMGLQPLWNWKYGPYYRWNSFNFMFKKLVLRHCSYLDWGDSHRKVVSTLLLVEFWLIWLSFTPKICIKYRKHRSSSFSHTFNCVSFGLFWPKKKFLKKVLKKFYWGDIMQLLVRTLQCF